MNVADFHPANFYQNAFSASMLAKFSLGLLYDQATVQVPEWRSGVDGLQKRAELRMGGLLTRAAVEYGVAHYRNTDPSYHRCHCKGFGPRSIHAFAAEFTEFRSDGSIAPPISRFAGLAASVAATSPFVGRHSANPMERGMTLLGADLGFNMLQEFWPEIRRTLLFRHR